MRALSGSPLTLGSALAAGGMLLVFACGDSGTGNTTADMGTGPDMTSPDGSPSLSAVSPRLVGTAGGDTLTLSGSGFQSGAQVLIGGTAVPASDVTVSSDGGSITVKAPARPGMAGKVDVTVKNPDGKSAVKGGVLAYFLSNVAFQTGTALSVDKGPRCVVAADLKKDGSVDLAVASADANTVSVFAGDGTGKFTMTANRGVGAYPYAISVGDLDADGSLDVVSANQSGTGSISVMRGDGKGGLDSAMASTNYLGNKPQAAVLADANNDGSLDLVVANFGNGNNSISVLTGNKSSMFGLTGSGMQTINGGLTGLYTLVADDFNMDGKIDVVGVYRQASGMSNVVTLLNKGGGASPYFTDAASKSGGGDPLSVAVGDVNGV